MPNTIMATVMSRIFDEGVRRGLSKTELTRLAGLPRARMVADARVSTAAIYDVMAHCLRETRDPSFPIAVARSVAVEDYSVLGFAMMTSPTAAVALERLARYGDFLSESGSWTTKTSREVLHLVWHRSGERTLGHRGANECALAEVVGGMLGSFGQAAQPLRVHFRHGRPDDTRAHDRYFGAKITWGSKTDSVELPARLLAHRPRGENAEMSQYFMRVLEQRSTRTATTTTDRVRTVLAEGLSSGVPTASALARELGMSERTLRRALVAEGTNYRALLDELRRDAAHAMLHAKKSVTETAFLLGFSETSALSRAFRRWHGAPAQIAGRAFPAYPQPPARARSRLRNRGPRRSRPRRSFVRGRPRPEPDDVRLGRDGRSRGEDPRSHGRARASRADRS